MAKRKTQSPKKSPAASKKAAPGKKPLGCLFWLAFVIVVSGLFYINRGLIKKTVEDTHLFDRLLNRTPVAGSAGEEPSESPGSDAAETAPEARPPAAETQDGGSGAASGGTEGRTSPPAGQDARPSSQNAAPTESQKPQAPPVGQNAAQNRPETLRERTIYFVKIDTDGTILRTAVTRKLNASDSPMLDTLGALLSGPDSAELRGGLITLIPQGTKILSATVRGSTAYISFNEDFQFNTNGADGYTAQLRQVVWTATEFSNIRDVQILIEGRRVDYLGESVWIGSPISRDML
ncbi:MAG: GerMN domain-containing protein [Spirochaetaceae bacterium]|nr:GerMN domain-containing protein [Spirochaetaceae bacterium]